MTNSIDGRISINKAAKQLGISRTRVVQYLSDERLSFVKEADGRIWLDIDEVLELERTRANGEETRHDNRLDKLEREAARDRARHEREQKEAERIAKDDAAARRQARLDSETMQFRSDLLRETKGLRQSIDALNLTLSVLTGAVAAKFGVDAIKKT